ncbi:CAP domain-containing protein [Solibacillus sp. FSL K6-1781]|uniref:CAP domain-containing protein n=1 Tax=Solibacillus sp. FSL K6-1781 TaxID=2921474 RepID=UPI00315B28D9
MNKKWLATSLCAATLFATSITAADAASLNIEVKSVSNPQNAQVIKGDNIQGFGLKIIDPIALSNGEFDLNKFKGLINKTLNNSKDNKVVEEGKVVHKEKATTNKETQKESTNKKVEKEVKVPQTPAKEVKAPQTPAKEKATPVTNNNNTKAPSNSKNQQVEAPVKTPSNNVSQSVSEFEKQVVDLTNAERAKEGLKPLEMHSPLMEVAQAKSEDMAKNNYFSHTSPTYGSPFDQIKSAGISYRSAGENIAQGQRTPQQVVQAWMESPGHRQNIMNANYTHIGVGFVENGYYWTQQFIQL